MKKHNIGADEAAPGVCVAWINLGNHAFRAMEVGITREEAMRKLAKRCHIKAWDEEND